MKLKVKGRSPGSAGNALWTLMPPKIARFSIIVWFVITSSTPL
jgi:hypothetical protein